MSNIEVVRSNGTNSLTSDKIGSDDEHTYFRVMTEKWGKLFFHSEDEYKRWCFTSRRQNEINGCFTAAKYYFENAFDDNEDVIIIEAYTA
jgi:hypothetical protein